MGKPFFAGKVLGTLRFDFDGDAVEVLKYHPYVMRGNHFTNEVDHARVNFSIESLSASYETIDHAVIGYIAHRRLGLNQYDLVSGIARALKCDGDA